MCKSVYLIIHPVLYSDRSYNDIKRCYEATGFELPTFRLAIDGSIDHATAASLFLSPNLFISGTFLLIYFVAMFACGIPIFFQEVAAGQVEFL
jgi:hypothetical protein